MHCKGVLQEGNRERECWLPAQSNSSFGLCRRCHFHKITYVLDAFTREYSQGILHPSNELLLQDRVFLDELLHPAREQALLNLLTTLFQTNRGQFADLLLRFKEKSVFSVLLTRRILSHVPGPRCDFYRHCMKDSKLYSADNLPWGCWSCIAWSLKQRDSTLLNLYTSSFARYFSRLTFQEYMNVGPRVFIDYFVSLHLLEKDHHIRILVDHMMRHFPLEDVKSFLLGFLQQPLMLSVFYENNQNDFLPLALRDEVVVQDFKRQIKLSIKNRTDTFKEDLMIKTWHPKRLFPWCLDIEEWADFGYSGRDSESWIDGTDRLSIG